MCVRVNQGRTRRRSEWDAKWMECEEEEEEKKKVEKR